LTHYRLKLFITGRSLKSENAIVNLRRICQQHLGDQADVIIVDVLEQPELAEQERIIATPTLVKEWPEPARRIVGDLSDTGRVLQALGVQRDARSGA